ncbi:Dolichol kinase EVAN [Porphyridium purpureum]|uniref:dolichol kinase n=1 Tax=Porphyridium purpureum TaxID=35688 RepID=A0A5J4ZB85_PORPP|nr:Dolichol kinase EVAN [Porphyridium purpureum]|eukprot:POR9564..scf295_1
MVLRAPEAECALLCILGVIAVVRLVGLRTETVPDKDVALIVGALLLAACAAAVCWLSVSNALICRHCKRQLGPQWSLNSASLMRVEAPASLPVGALSAPVAFAGYVVAVRNERELHGPLMFLAASATMGLMLCCAWWKKASAGPSCGLPAAKICTGFSLWSTSLTSRLSRHSSGKSVVQCGACFVFPLSVCVAALGDIIPEAWRMDHALTWWTLYAASWLGMVLTMVLVTEFICISPPSFSFTLSEACVIGQALSVALCSLCRLTLTTVLGHVGWHSNIPQDHARALVLLFMFAMAMGGSRLIVTALRCSSKPGDSAKRWLQEGGGSIFIRDFAVIVLGIMYPLCWVLLGAEPFRWLLQFLSSTRRLVIAAYWLALLGTFVRIVKPHERPRMPRTTARKLYHILAVLVFVPISVVDPELLQVGAAGAAAVLFLLEVVRCASMPKVSPSLNVFMRALTDERDSGVLITTHMLLLVGCAGPLWVEDRISLHAQSFASRSRALSGVIAVGVLDSLASFIGVHFGRTPWSAGTPKSVEGSSAGFVGAVACFYAIHCFTSSSPLAPIPAPLSTRIPLMSSDIRSAAAVALASALAAVFEAHTTQIDNLVLPLYLHAALSLLL